jgi:transcriptional regulator with XRE-family HTH domain
MRKKILPQVAARLKKIRRQIGCDKKEMAARLGVTTSGYYKNEHGETLPSVSSLKRLSDDFNISMDWFFFNKGPMHYEEKAKKEMELEQEVKKLNAELNQERKNLQAECKKRDEELKKHQEKTAFIESRPKNYWNTLRRSRYFIINSWFFSRSIKWSTMNRDDQNNHLLVPPNFIILHSISMSDNVKKKKKKVPGKQKQARKIKPCCAKWVLKWTR